MKHPTFYTVTLNPSIDYVVRMDGPLCLGGVNRSAGEAYQLAGKGINVANVLRALGHEVTALGFVAGFTGKALEDGLASLGLRTDFVPVSGMTRINVKLKAGEETEINGRGPAITAEDMGKLYARLDRLRPGDTLVLSGSLPAGLPEDTYEAILRFLDGRGLHTAVDTEGDALLRTLPYRPFLIKPNRQELAAIFGEGRDLLSCARELQRQGAQNVLVSLAGDGALLLDEHGVCHKTGCPKGTVQNSVGAGDSMVAGFLAGYLASGDYGYALRLGTAAGSATAFSLGLAEKPEILAALESLR